MEHRDFLGNEIEVGDEVAYMLGGYRELQRGTVIKVTPRMLFVDNFKQFHSQVIVIKHLIN